MNPLHSFFQKMRSITQILFSPKEFIISLQSLLASRDMQSLKKAHEFIKETYSSITIPEKALFLHRITNQLNSFGLYSQIFFDYMMEHNLERAISYAIEEGYHLPLLIIFSLPEISPDFVLTSDLREFQKNDPKYSRYLMFENIQNIVENHAYIGDTPPINSNNSIKPLHLAVEKRDHLLIQIIVACRGNINCADKFNDTPLHYATILGYLDTVNLLLSLDASPSLKNREINSLDLAIKMNQIEIIKSLDISKQPWTISQKLSALSWAFHGKSTELISFLLKTFKIPITSVDEEGQTLLHYAAKKNDLHTFKNLFQNNSFDLTARSTRDETPFYIAAVHNNFDVLSYIIENHPNISTEFTNLKKNPLNQISYTTHLKEIDHIIASLQKNPILSAKIMNDMIIYRMSCYPLDIEEIYALIEKGGDRCFFIRSNKSIFTTAVQRSEDLRKAAKEENLLDPIDFILSKIRTNTPNRNQMISEVLYWSARNSENNLPICKNLLRIGADPNYPTVWSYENPTSSESTINCILLDCSQELFYIHIFLEILIAYKKIDLSRKYVYHENPTILRLPLEFSLSTPAKQLLEAYRDKPIDTMIQMQKTPSQRI